MKKVGLFFFAIQVSVVEPVKCVSSYYKTPFEKPSFLPALFLLCKAMSQ